MHRFRHITVHSGAEGSTIPKPPPCPDQSGYCSTLTGPPTRLATVRSGSGSGHFGQNLNSNLKVRSGISRTLTRTSRFRFGRFGSGSNLGPVVKNQFFVQRYIKLVYTSYSPSVSASKSTSESVSSQASLWRAVSILLMWQRRVIGAHRDMAKMVGGAHCDMTKVLVVWCLS